jgi:uncharacterized protein YndB with AHSA1/START domain
MPTARASRTIAAPVDELWELIGDPHHLPRWWPRVSRVEDVTPTGTDEHGAFTEVMKTAKGKTVRADFELVEAKGGERSLRWRQRIAGTPFARVLKTAETEVSLRPAPASSPPLVGASVDGSSGSVGVSEATGPTEVTIELHQTLSGFFPRFGGHMVRRAARATIEEALDGLQRIHGR